MNSAFAKNKDRLSIEAMHLAKERMQTERQRQKDKKRANTNLANNYFLFHINCLITLL